MPRSADAEIVALPVPRRPAEERQGQESHESQGGREDRARRPAARDRPGLGRWPGYVLVACGIALVPWLVVLATGLPSTDTAPHWTVAWVGLDSMEAVGLMATGLLTLRRGAHRVPVAAATAMLLVCDAWFDTTTASGSGLGVALLMALTAELPLAAVCGAVALRGTPRSAPGTPPYAAQTCPRASAPQVPHVPQLPHVPRRPRPASGRGRTAAENRAPAAEDQQPTSREAR